MNAEVFPVTDPACAYTTPLDREILTHYYVSPEPFPRSGGSNSETVQRFIRLGLLVELPQANKYGSTIEANREAIRVYMDALGRVPLPVQRWVIP